MYHHQQETNDIYKKQQHDNQNRSSQASERASIDLDQILLPSLNVLTTTTTTTSSYTLVDRKFTKDEIDILENINNCLKNWYPSWKNTFLSAGREYTKVYQLMEELFHYEDQIKKSDSSLPGEKTDAISKIVARLIDYGNAILNIDMIVRTDDGTLREIDPQQVTTIELFQAHIYSHNWRDKLMRDYFESDRPKAIDLNNSIPYQELETISITTDRPVSPINQLLSLSASSSISHQQINQLQTNTSKHLTPPAERPQRISLPSPRASAEAPTYETTALKASPLSNFDYISLPTSHSGNDLLSKQIEIGPFISVIKSEAFCNSQSTRTKILPTVLKKIESFMINLQTAEKVNKCFELIGVLLDAVEKIPRASRAQDVASIAKVLLRPIVNKVFVQDRDSVVEFQHAHWTTFLISIIGLMNTNDFSAYLKNFSSQATIAQFLKDYLFILKQFMSSGPPIGEHRRSISIYPGMEFSINMFNHSYPDFWIEMSLVACKVFLNSLNYLNQVIQQMFGTNLQMWSSFIDSMIHFGLQKTLRPGRHMLKNRQTLLADDIINKLISHIWYAWDGVWHRNIRQETIDELVGPLLNFTMILKSKQREMLGPIFHDMARYDYASQYRKQSESIYMESSNTSASSCSTVSTNINPPVKRQEMIENTGGYIDHAVFDQHPNSSPQINIKNTQNNQVSDNELPYLNLYREASIMSYDGTVLTKFTHLIIDELNTLMIDKDLGDNIFCDDLWAFISGEQSGVLYHRYNFSSSKDADQFKVMAVHTADLVVEFIKICLDYRQANKLNYGHVYLLCIFRLVMFFRDKVQRSELYLFYLYRLFYLHHTAGRYAEAGYTLLEHAKSLEWSENQVENKCRTLISQLFQKPITDCLSLKILLYELIINYFDQAQLWEAAVPLFQELADIYRVRTFEYDKLAILLQRMSQNYFNIITLHKTRAQPEYYRVSFYGKGFPEPIRNATMVYRGKPFEKLNEFTAIMEMKYPDATIYKSKTKPSNSELEQADAKYMLINKCSPITDLQTIFGAKLSKIDDALLVYYKYNVCDKFYYDRNIPNPYETTNNKSYNPDDVGSSWLERTVLTTSRLPGILPFFQVFCDETKIVTPIENAIERMEEKNEELSSMINRFKVDKHNNEDVRLFTQLLSGIINPAVNGGITKYEEAFFMQNQSMTTLSTTSVDNPNKHSTNTLLGIPKDKQSDGKHKSNHLSVLMGMHMADNARSSCSTVESSTNNAYHQGQNDPALVNKLKCLIARQVPLLDEALKLHRARVADVMMPQHEHLEECYKKLKGHILMNYSRYLPQDYSRSTMRSFRSARSPNRSRHMSISGLSGSSARSSMNSSLLMTTNENPSTNQGEEEIQRSARISLQSENGSSKRSSSGHSSFRGEIYSDIPYVQFSNSGKVHAKMNPDKELGKPIAMIQRDSSLDEMKMNYETLNHLNDRIKFQKLVARGSALPILKADGLVGLSAVIKQDATNKNDYPTEPFVSEVTLSSIN